MKKQRNPINVDIAIGLIMLGALAVAYWAGTKKHEPETPQEIVQDQEMEAEVNELKLILANLKDKVNAVDEKYSSTPANDAAEPSASTQVISGALAPRMGDLQQTEVFAKEQQGDAEAKLARASAQYYAEAIEGEWATDQEQAIADAMHQNAELRQLHMSDLQCRSHSCRVVLNVDAKAEPDTALSLVGELGRELPYAQWQQQGRQLVLLLSERDLTQVP